MDFSVGIDALEATAVGKSRPLPGVFLAVASLERVGARSTACVFALARREIGCAWFEQASATVPAPPRISSTQTTAWRVHAPTAKPFSPTSFMLQ